MRVALMLALPLLLAPACKSPEHADEHHFVDEDGDGLPDSRAENGDADGFSDTDGDGLPDAKGSGN